MPDNIALILLAAGAAFGAMALVQILFQRAVIGRVGFFRMRRR